MNRRGVLVIYQKRKIIGRRDIELEWVVVLKRLLNIFSS